MTGSSPVRYEAGVLHVLDQTALPHDEVWKQLRHPGEVAEAIASLRVRGAPLIGVTAAYGVAAAARASAQPVPAAESAAATIAAARPTAVNLAWAVQRVLVAVRAAASDGRDPADAAEDEARAVHAFEVSACERMAAHGSVLIDEGSSVMTYCNTGALATGGAGSALAVIGAAHDASRVRHVWVPETRPLLQGSRLTAWELQRLGIPFTMIADAAAGSVFARGLVDAVIVGADRIAANGDTANKVGTYTLAVLADRHDVRFYVVAPSSTLDPGTPSGDDIPIEEREADEVRTALGVPIAPLGAPAANPAFDVTPGELITAIVTEEQVFRPPYRFA